jgi:hypothetical protein
LAFIDAAASMQIGLQTSPHRDQSQPLTQDGAISFAALGTSEAGARAMIAAGVRPMRQPAPNQLVVVRRGMLQLIIIGTATFGLFGMLVYVEKRSDDWNDSTRIPWSSNPSFQPNQPLVPRLTRSADIKLNERV